jgi:benzoyl-CoA reductase/2-hydroxyglutaryl-CoA dehydratase subunit BcrC/BadD/HgdB
LAFTFGYFQQQLEIKPRRLSFIAFENPLSCFLCNDGGKFDRSRDMPYGKLKEHLLGRPAELKKLQREGKKVVGYFPGEYVPEEIIHAAGAVPISFIHGGDPESVEAAHSAITRFVCPFSKAQFGYRILREQLYYEILDLLIAPITCQHLRRVADMYNYYTDVDVFRLGVPFEYNSESALAYYIESLQLMAGKLEETTGESITRKKLKESISLYNRMRSLLKEIATMRMEERFPLTSLDFIKLNHASYYADLGLMIGTLESVCQELKQIDAPVRIGPRILLAGPNLALGDYKVPELIEEAGGQVVFELMDEGMRFSWVNVDVNEDLWESLARRYLSERLPCVFMIKAYQDRVGFITEKAKAYRVDGVIWYQLKYCETADIDSFYIGQQIKKTGIPFLKLESDYDVSDRGPLRTRIEAFIEMLKGR